MDDIQETSLRLAENMKLFEFGGKFYIGLWQRWRLLNKEDGDKLLFDFRAECYL
jgi:hypothetical protein